MKKFLADILTGKDGHTYDIGRILWAWSVVSFTALGGYDLVHAGYRFDPVAYGTGIAAVLASGGAALGLKARTEPEP